MRSLMQIIVVFMVKMMAKGTAVSERNIYAEKGEDVQLVCPLRGDSIGWNGPPNFILYATLNKTYFDYIEILRNETTNSQVLQINNFTIENEGIYRCDNIIQDFKFKVVVKKPPTAMIIEDEKEHGLIYGIENNYVTLKCSFNSGKTKTHLVWSQGNEILKYGGHGKVEYQISATMSHHEVNYTCKALDENNSTVLAKTVRLYIYSQPNISLPDSITTTEGGSFLKNCSFVSNDPKAVAMWTREDDFTFTNALNFVPVSRHHAGNYTCKVISRGQITTKVLHIVVQYPPDVTVVQIKNSTNKYDLVCQASGVPDNYTFYQWVHRSLHGEHIRFLNGTTDGILTIHVSTEYTHYYNSGIYICSVSNGIQSDGVAVKSANCTVKLPGKPYFLDKIEKEGFGTFRKSAKIRTFVYSYPKLEKMSVHDEQGKAVLQLAGPKSTFREITIVDTFYGKDIRVHVNEIDVEVPWIKGVNYHNFTINVTNNIGSTTFVVNIMNMDFAYNEDVPETYSGILGITALMLGIAFVSGVGLYLLHSKGLITQFTNGSCNCLKRRSNGVPDVDVSGGGVNNELYSSIDRQHNLQLGQEIAYAMSNSQTGERENVIVKKPQTSRRTYATNQDNAKLNYIEVSFVNSPGFYIHGNEDRTPYSEIDFSLKAEPLPESDSERSDDDGTTETDFKKSD